MSIDQFPDARDDELARLVGELRSDLARRCTRATATGIVMVLDDIDAGDADLRITACAGRHHLDVDTLAATICRTNALPMMFRTPATAGHPERSAFTCTGDGVSVKKRPIHRLRALPPRVEIVTSPPDAWRAHLGDVLGNSALCRRPAINHAAAMAEAPECVPVQPVAPGLRLLTEFGRVTGRRVRRTATSVVRAGRTATTCFRGVSAAGPFVRELLSTTHSTGCST